MQFSYLVYICSVVYLNVIKCNSLLSRPFFLKTFSFKNLSFKDFLVSKKLVIKLDLTNFFSFCCKSRMQYLTWILTLYPVGMWAILNNRLTCQTTNEQGDQMSIPTSENTADWIHLVIFKPMKVILLTQSTFKVTTYIVFVPYLCMIIYKILREI